jgi:hypothetical protein
MNQTIIEIKSMANYTAYKSGCIIGGFVLYNRPMGVNATENESYNKMCGGI